ncbi:DELLA protein RGL1-like [Coffea arabica]|uniref:DELLA protein RGL1-like n=1 Tax=Coffea arabica TaxID=13443 RepID=A0A6P6XA01_COFAR|nr:DELLA protein RGL1-like [Coffea arabica]
MEDYEADEQEANGGKKQRQPPQPPDTDWFDVEDNSLYGLYQQQNNPTPSKVAFLEGGQQATSTPPQFNWVQNDFQHLVSTPALHSFQPIYDQATAKNNEQPQQQRLPETGGKWQQLKGKTHSFTLASLELLSNYGKGFKNAAREDQNWSNDSPTNIDQDSSQGRRLSLGEIIRAAGERYIQFSTKNVDGFSGLIHPYASTITDISVAETADVELVQFLLIAAECVGHKKFDLASGLITRCLCIASDSGNAAQRIVFHFAEALQHRIDMQTGKITPERIIERFAYARNLELDFNLSFLACHQAIPFTQVTQFAAMQAIIDNVKSATKIHLVDLHIRSGVQWTVLMQALVERDDPPALRITAVGTMNKQRMEETGKRLISFAQSLNLSLSFNVVMVSDMEELKEDMLSKAPDEAVAVYSPLILRTMISKPESLRNVIKVIRRMKPAVVVVTEVEANHNSPLFISRFTESLFFYSAFFDCLEDCMERNNEHRKTIEGIYLGEGIRNMVGSEGDKRCTRNVMIDVWREFFTRYGMVEVELSHSSLQQANMILKRFHKASSCNLINAGKGIVIGWKGTPIHSLTAWKFM